MLRIVLLAATLLTAGLALVPNAAADCYNLSTDPSELIDEECDGGFPVDRVVGLARKVTECIEPQPHVPC